MLTSDFDFSFPEDRIALRPLPRGEARLMAVSASGALPGDFPLTPEPGRPDRAFGQARDFVAALKAGDALALNDTKVLRARLHGALASGAACEVLLIKPRAGGEKASVWECLAKPGRKLQPGARVTFPGGEGAELSAEVTEVLPGGERVLRFNRGEAEFLAALEKTGEIPLPPYIRRKADAEDAETYQTVFAEHAGSVAAPTASLHLSTAMLREIEARGVRIAKLTLHVGAGTFRPVQTDHLEAHAMHSETFTLSPESAAILNAARAAGGRIFAVGTTAARVLETCADERGVLHPRAGETDIFMYPGYRWKAVDGLLTNFHWPKSTLFMLVASRLGTEKAKAVYADAIGRGFRLFSYGDAMLILS